MKPQRGQELLGGSAAVKGTMLHAHLAWAADRVPDLAAVLLPRLDEECRRLIHSGFLDTDWIPFRCLVRVDRALAEVLGGQAEAVFRELGAHSARLNLTGVYRIFMAEEPHRFFAKTARLHGQFQNFGRAEYERTGESSGRVRIDQYEEYSPAYCASALGYYAEALHLMHVPGPVTVTESACRCAAQPACVFELSW